MKNKIALVTGGSRGLGRDMALSLAGKGINVVLTYQNNKEAAEEVVKEIADKREKAVALPLDVGDIGGLDGFVEKLRDTLKTHWNTGSFDFLINNAGVGATLPIAQVKEEDFDRLMNVHYKGVYFLTQKTLPMLNDGGSVIFISSGTTRFCVPGYSVYSSLKAAIEVLAKYVAKEYGERGIRANVVAPGAIETDFNGAAIRNNPQLKSFLAGQTALGRVGNADDIGSVVTFLCTEDAKWVNGQRVEASGGMFL